MTAPTDPARWTALRCSFCGHWEKGQRTKAQVADWLRVHKAALLGTYDGAAGELASICPHPCGSGDPARWTIDDDWLISPGIMRSAIASWDNDEFCNADLRLSPDDFAALVADVRAARIHEGCAHATDTLRQALAAADACIRRYRAGWWTELHDEVWWSRDLRTSEPMAEAEIEATNRARLAAEGPDHE